MVNWLTQNFRLQVNLKNTDLSIKATKFTTGQKISEISFGRFSLSSLLTNLQICMSAVSSCEKCHNNFLLPCSAVLWPDLEHMSFSPACHGKFLRDEVFDVQIKQQQQQLKLF